LELLYLAYANLFYETRMYPYVSLAVYEEIYYTEGGKLMLFEKVEMVESPSIFGVIIGIIGALVIC